MTLEFVVVCKGGVDVTLENIPDDSSALYLILVVVHVIVTR